MTDFTLITREEMKAEFKLFTQRIHRTKKYRERTCELLKGIRIDCKRPGAALNGWQRLTALNELGESGNPVITGSEVKGAFRDFQLPRQGGRCCYCRRWLVQSAHAMPIDHVLPKDEEKYPQFALHFWNLALACADCNGLKSNKVWESLPSTRARYGSPDEFKVSFHPRFHKYDEHVRFVRIETNGTAVVLFKGQTDQGRHLCANLLGEVAGREALLAGSATLAASLATLAAFNAGDGSEQTPAVQEFQSLLKMAATKVLSDKRRGV